MKFKITLALGLALLTGCQKSALNNESDVSAAAVACESSLDNSSTDGSLKIVGESAVQSGDASQYALKSAGHCVDGTSVNWKAAGSSVSKTSSAGLTSVFKRAGNYVVTAQEKATSADSEVVSFRTAVVSDQMSIVGPQVGYSFNPIRVELAIPVDVAVQAITWDFVDGSSLVEDQIAAEHTYFDVGTYIIKAKVTDLDNKVTDLTHRIQIINYQEDIPCIGDLAISGATEAKAKVATTMSVFIPSCLTSKVGAVRWDFGDGESASNQSVSHAYAAVGTYDVSATLFLGTSTTPWVTLHHSIRVIENLDVEPEPEEPLEPGACKIQNETRESYGEIYSEEVACGINGKKTVSYKDLVKEECQMASEKLSWIEISRKKEITNEGPCQGQSCQLPDGSLLANGASMVLFSNATPQSSCASVSEQRTCNNGVLSGSSSHNQMKCNEGCGDFGSHGTVKTGVVTGETKVPLTCTYGEEGFFDTFTELTDQTCKDGQVVASNVRKGTLVTAGSCPTYQYASTENFTACSADCGGTQNRIFVCQNDKGVQVDAVRCQNLTAPVESRVCDGNPAAVRTESVVTVQEDASSSSLCPKNQIGIVSKTRDVATTKVYACIDHKVQLESSTTVNGAWVEESYCRNYVAYRCSQDSLSNADAKGRYEWMVKCQDQLPIIKDFLTNFASVKMSVGGKEVSISSTGGREIYPTFMNYGTSPEKPWIAPKTKSAACVMPATVYVATVCVSSCATPEQQILAEDLNTKKLKYISFIDALTQNVPYVASLHDQSSMNQKVVTKTKVDQWVTELIDTEHKILVFNMKSGRELRVTENHPILTADGSMKVASDFIVGESLVELGGSLDPIVSITPIKHFGKVYNVFVQSDAPHKNVLVTNGYLNGSAYFQNAGAKDMNRSLFRKNLIRGAF